MKHISISKTDRLYRLFSWFANSSYFSFVYYDHNDDINSFSDVCTFVQHCLRIILSSLGYLIFALALIFLFGLILSSFVVPVILGFIDLGSHKLTPFTTTIIMYPIIIYTVYRLNVNSENRDNKEPSGEDGIISKFVEIASEHSSKYCVKIDIVDDSKKGCE